MSLAARKRKFRAHGSRKADALDANLRPIFDGLAQLLVVSGYGYARVARLMKFSFVNAARSIDGQKGGKVSNARVAALTGLTRTEVSQLLRQGEETLQNPADQANRALRVVRGWISDLKYMDSNNSPRKLSFKGESSSFSSLVKKYSGDIPARAMLAEMKRLRIVRVDTHDCVSLVRKSLPISRKTRLTMRAISPWLEMLTSTNNADRFGEVVSKAKQVSLDFNSLPQLLAAVRELEHRRVAFIDGLEQLGTRSSKSRKHSLRVSIAVAAEKTTLRASIGNTRRQNER
jgi:hypothetical protein